MDDRFKLFTWGPLPRLLSAGVLWAAGVVLQYRMPDFWWGGLALLVLGAAALLLKNVTNKPKDQGKEEWRPVTIAEVDRLMDALARSRRLQKKFMGQGCLLLVLGATVFGGIFFALDENALVGTFLFDTALFFLAGAAGGLVNVYYPEELSLKMTAFRPLLEWKAPEGLTLVPCLRFDEDEVGRDIPEDLRFQLEKKKAPEDFRGIQFQAAINKGPNGNVPYVYAVALTKGQTGAAARSLQSRAPSGWVVEKGGDANFGTLVIRQHTEGGGYATGPDDVQRLLRDCVALAQGLSTGN